MNLKSNEWGIMLLFLKMNPTLTVAGAAYRLRIYRHFKQLKGANR